MRTLAFILIPHSAPMGDKTYVPSQTVKYNCGLND